MREDLNVSEMLKMQRELHARYEGVWDPLTPQYGRNSVLWMIDEIGEVIAIIKKRGDKDIMENANVRAHFVEELTDVAMYFHDVLLRYGVTAEEFSKAYSDKHAYDMRRDYIGERAKLDK